MWLTKARFGQTMRLQLSALHDVISALRLMKEELVKINTRLSALEEKLDQRDG